MRISDWSSDVCSSDLLDVYGEVLDVLLVAGRNAMQEDGDELVRLLADRLEECWHQPDAGIWESRGEAHQHTYSKVMRSEEHTSELQSLMRISYAVFCLKKKKK